VHLLNWAGSLFLVAQYAMYSSQRVVGNFLVQQLPIYIPPLAVDTRIFLCPALDSCTSGAQTHTCSAVG
jgi:hypothetical protein